MKTTLKLLLITSILISTFSCSKKGGTTPDPIIPDTTKPTISVTKPTVGQTFTAGNTIIFQATFNDNIGLKSYEIVISKVVTGGLILKNVPTSVPYSYTKSSTSFSTGVKQEVVNLSDMVIPANTANTIVTPGNYNVKVTCYDTSNNMSEMTVVIGIN